MSRCYPYNICNAFRAARRITHWVVQDRRDPESPAGPQVVTLPTRLGLITSKPIPHGLVKTCDAVLIPGTCPERAQLRSAVSPWVAVHQQMPEWQRYP